MKFGILVFTSPQKEVLPEYISRLVAKIGELGHMAIILFEDNIQLRFGFENSVYYNGKPLEKFDAIIVLAGFQADPSIHATTIRQFELEGIVVVNGYIGVHRAKNKIRTLQLFHHFGLPMPRTVVVRSVDGIDDVIDEFKFPVILKVPYGSQGLGVFIAESKRSLVSFAEHLLKRGVTKEPIKIQEYIAEAEGKDIRLFVVGKKVVASMERSAAPGEFRANFSRGGSVRKIIPTLKEKRLAVEATKRMGLDFSGVDILRTKHGPVIIEVNSNPGYEGIMQATNADIPKKIVEHAVQKVKKTLTKARTKKLIRVEA